MKLVTFAAPDGGPRPGVLEEDGVIDLTTLRPDLPRSVRGLLEAGALLKLAEALESSAVERLSNVKLLAPVPDPKKVFGIGLNYRDHAVESGMAIPDEPIVFVKASSAIAGPDETIRLPSLSTEVDYEAELVVVIGQRAAAVPESQAMRYVAGYTIGNDVSARDWQLRKPGGQWTLGKSFSTFAPIGPALVTRDEIPDPHVLPIGLRLNGREMQRSSTSQLIFRIDQLIAYLSRICPLEPGDLIFTGTPPGVGFARKPPVFLHPGDVCEITIDGLGTLRNPCAKGD
ncbi:MAG TPA: fumarylacetoacetate hydrolase family protein [Lacipirellulaceae bacterium]|nr:fumarylacetoacetate hydrolase family protein [Lacipirellulaceae bacterium]